MNSAQNNVGISPWRGLGTVVLSLVPVLGGCGGEPEGTVEVIRPVRAEQVFSGGTRSRTFTGTARAAEESRLSFRVAGAILGLNVDVGSSVASGAVIAVLDPIDYELQVREAQASLAQAQAAERNASADYERTQGLFESGTASASDLDAARAGFESTAASVESIQSRLQLARQQLSYTRLTAPRDGAIADLAVEVNENVGPGQTIVVLTSGDRPEVEVAIPEVVIGDFATGGTASVSFDAVPGVEFAATVTEVGVAATRSANTFPVTVRLDEEPERVRPGMTAEVEFRFESEGPANRVLVPPASVEQDGSGTFVFVIEPQSEGRAVARRQTVRIGELTSQGLEVLDGLEDRDYVATAGVSILTDGQVVRLVEN